MHRRRARRTRRGRRAGRTAKRGRTGLTNRVRALENSKEEAKHIIYSDDAVPAATVLTNSFNVRAAAPFIGLLNPLSRGTTVQQRIGDKVMWTSLNLNLHIYANGNITDETWVRWRLVKHIQPLGTALSASSYLAINFGVSAPGLPFMMRNINNQDPKDRFATLKSGIIKFTNVSNSGQEVKMIPIRYRKPIETSYHLGNNGTIADIARNALYLIVWTNSSITTGGLTISCEAQVFFHG